MSQLSVNLQPVRNVITNLLNWARANPGRASVIGSIALYVALKKLTKKYKNLAEKVVLITGGASGIGLLMAKKCAALGSDVVLWDICAEERLEQAKQEIQGVAGSRQVFTYQVDVTDKKTVDEVAQRTLRDAGQVDILINNAGIVSGKPILELEEEEIERTFKVNVISHFWTLQNFLPGMLERNSGHIVTIASAAGYFGCPKLTDYCASKFAAVGLDEALRLELRKLGKTGVKTTCVCPFYISTGMFEGVSAGVVPLTLPILKPEYAASEIIRAIRTDEPRLTMPRMVGIGIVLKHLSPIWLGDTISDLTGTGKSMDNFIGRKEK